MGVVGVGVLDGLFICWVVDRGFSRVGWVLGNRIIRWVYEVRFWGCRVSFGVLGVRVYWLYWDVCYGNFLV